MDEIDDDDLFTEFSKHTPAPPAPKRKKSYGGPKCFHCGEVIKGPIVFKGPNKFHKDCPRHAGRQGPTNNGDTS